MLSALPSPSMPDDVTAAITRRLADESTVVPITRRHSRRMTWLVAAASVLGVLALVGLGFDESPSAPVTAAPIVRAGAVFEPAGFAQQLQSRMGDGPASNSTGTFADDTAGQRACATSVKAYGRVMFLDVGTYDANSAVVMVTSYPANSDYQEVWVVSPDCGQGDATVYRHMLYDLDGPGSS